MPIGCVFQKGEYKTAGVIEREQELRDIKHAMIAQKTLIEQAAQSLASNETVLTQLEQQRTDLKDALSEAEANYAGLNAKLQMMQAQIERLSQHHARLNEEYNEQHHQIETSVAALVDARQLWAQATADMEKYTEIREGLLKRRDENRHHVQMARTDAERDQHQLHDLQLHWETANTQVNALKQSIERIHHQVSGLQKRRDQLMTDLTEDDAPLEQLEQELDVALEKRAAIETALTAAKQKVDNIEAEIQLFIQQRHETEQTLEDARNALEEKRMHGQELKIRQTTLNEQLSASSFNLEQVIESLPEEATEAEWADRLEKTATRIGRLGAINLAAIEEYGQCEERKNYLDAQHADLEEALTTLQDAIRKIDRETRSRFKETFDKVNITFQALFPKIFGGGNAYLELTGDDLLDTGVALMARPPGKRISNIHLLSGGEKALTAMALVFSLFQLNPAPFCMLDEVDAPLDDVNVGRFCELVKEMSQQVQFIFISHNKNAIEMADHLMGVTMHEPGVSRIVSVDIAAAVSMAES